MMCMRQTMDSKAMIGNSRWRIWHRALQIRQIKGCLTHASSGNLNVCFSRVASVQMSYP